MPSIEQFRETVPDRADDYLRYDGFLVAFLYKKKQAKKVDQLLSRPLPPSRQGQPGDGDEHCQILLANMEPYIPSIRGKLAEARREYYQKTQLDKFAPETLFLPRLQQVPCFVFFNSFDLPYRRTYMLHPSPRIDLGNTIRAISDYCQKVWTPFDPDADSDSIADHRKSKIIALAARLSETPDLIPTEE